MTLQEQIRSNQLRTAVVILGFGVLVGALVLLVGGVYDPGLAGVLGIFAIGYGLVSYFASGKMVASAAGARPIREGEAPGLEQMVDTLSIAAGLSRTPPVYLFDDPAPNAFAAGRKPDQSYVAFSTGLLTLMDKRELEGVIAHELAHVRNRDVRLMTIATVLVGVVMLVSDIIMRTAIWGGAGRRNREMGIIGVVVGIAAAILAPIAAAMLQMALSRRREYLADASAVEIIGDANGLARALQKLADDTQPLRKVTRATAHMYIESPLRDHKGLRSSLGGLFDTHPPLEERIERLRVMSGAFTA